MAAALLAAALPTARINSGRLRLLWIRVFGFSFVSLFGASLLGQINSWTNPASAKWEESYWSLGMLPNSNQSVVITNAGFKAVAVWPSTVADFPASQTVSNLTVNAPGGSFNRLLLNFSNSDVPLHVRNAFTIGTNGSLMNLYGGLQVDGVAGGTFDICGGEVIQESGITVATNVPTSVISGNVNVTNANLWFGPLTLGDVPSLGAGNFTQSGGAVSYSTMWISNGVYTLMGNASLSGAEMRIAALTNASARFIQSSGTNSGNFTVGNNINLIWSGEYKLLSGMVRAGEMKLIGNGRFIQSGGLVTSISNSVSGPDPGYPNGSYALSNGVLRVRDWTLVNGHVDQFGGEHTITNPLALTGYYRDDHGFIQSRKTAYFLSGGTLTVPAINLTFFGFFNQSGGSNRVAGNISVAGTIFTLSGGVLSNANTFLAPGNQPSGENLESGTFEQKGGTHIIGGVLSNTSSSFYFTSGYRLSGGTLMVPTILMAGNRAVFAISNSPTINNSLFQFGGGTIQADGSAQFGQLALASNSVIAFSSNTASVSFLNSASAAWSGDATLTISNWNGSTNGGGMHRLYIGTSSNGITANQLSRIRFVNPAAKLKGRYPAVILNTGEIVIDPNNAVLVGGWGAEDPFAADNGAEYAERLTVYPEASTNVIAISAGNPNLTLRADGTVLTWGDWGAPIPPEENHDLIAISASSFHSLALRSNGTVLAWGYEYDTTRTNVPAGLSNVVAISAGDSHSLALRDDGTIVAWGWSGATNGPPAAMPAIAISAGAAHSLALKADGTAIGWGQSTYGEADIPAGLSNVVAIEAGYFASFAIKSDGTVAAWGWNDFGQTNVPPGLSNVVAFSAGHSHVLALKADGTVTAWGNTNLSHETVVPPWLSNVRAVAAGGNYSLVLLHGGPYLRAPISNASHGNGQFSFSLPTRSGHVYALEHVTDLTNSNWQLVFPLGAGQAGLSAFADQSTATPQRFYRVREW
jgi:hypothetical protein